MKRLFETPDFEIVHFESDDIITTSSCCDVLGIEMPSDTDVCPSGDAECSCGSDVDQNCVT